MFNPEMMAMAQDMMSKMTPEQMAQMQRQMQNISPDMMQTAMNQMQNMTPEQIQQMRAATQNMTGEQIAAQASAGVGQASAQQQYGLTASEQLKAEGNRLHGAKQYKEAADKYQRAISNLTGQTSLAARQLRTSCQSNLASCYLQLQRWQECVDQCGEVLAVDASNRKALYRRGQALCALERYDAAVEDLRQAVRLSPENEKDLIREKLAEAKQKQRQAQQGVIIEEVTELAAADEQPPAPTQQPATGAAVEAAKQQQEGLAESESDDDMPPLEEPAGGASAATASAAPAAPAMPAFPPGGFGMPAGMPPGMDAQRMQQAQEMFKSNPEMARQAASAMAAMSDDQLASMLAQSGMPGVTPEMAKQAASMMRSMPPDQLAAMAQAQAAAGFPGAPAAGVPAAPAAAAPAAPVAPAATATAGVVPAAAAGGSPDQMAEAMKQNPEMLKQAATMMENMSEEQLRSMASMMPGGAAMDPAQLKMAAAMMKNMSPEDMERMTRMATSMGAVPGAGPAAAAGGADAAAAPASASGAAVGGMPMGMPPGFDPSSMPPEMMADMRKRMQDPEMLRMMKNMLKSMDPESLAAAMQQSGMNVTAEQARAIADKLDSVSDKHLELMARLMGWVNAAIDMYRRTKAWVLSQGALALAILVLIVALLLRWLGWL